MIQTILTLWLVLSFPIAVSVDNKMAREGRDERHSFLWQLSLMKNCMLNVPVFYSLLVLELLFYKRK
jgi:hypothetical protein